MSTDNPYPPDGYTLRVTEPSGRSHTHGADDGRTGWKRHAVPDGSDRAACGLLPKLGWGGDLFEGSMDDCKRCLVATGSCSRCFDELRVSVVVSTSDDGRSRHYKHIDCPKCTEAKS